LRRLDYLKYKQLIKLRMRIGRSRRKRGKGRKKRLSKRYRRTQRI
jgi:hypothetical protein